MNAFAPIALDLQGMAKSSSDFSGQYIHWSRRLLPMPFGIAVVLTLVVFILAALAGKPQDTSTPIKISSLIRSWEQGIWSRGGMVFTFQMLLILVFGHILALSKPVDSLITQLLNYCRDTASSAAVVALVTLLAALINWGLGLILGAVFVRKVGELARREGRSLNYPLVGASGYVGMMVWHGGLSGSAPLTVNTPDHNLVDVMGVIPLSQTLGSAMNLWVIGFCLVLLPGMLYLLGRKYPKSDVALPNDGKLVAQGASPATQAERFTSPLDYADPDSEVRVEEKGWLDYSRWAAWFFGLLLLAGCWFRFMDSEGKSEFRFLTLDFINLFLFGAGLILHGSFARFTKALEKAMPGAAGIAIQFPLYFGIMGLMQDFGLIQWMAEGFIRISTASSFPLLAFTSAGIVNIFVPSGGGQWQVQGPILIRAAQQLGVSDWQTIMALAYGDQLTNMMQPFWALPLLGITGLTARQVLPYTLLLMLGGIVIFASALYLF